MAPNRRILSLWLPRLAAERAVRRASTISDTPIALAVVSEEQTALRIHSLTREADRRGVRLGQALADARAICPDLRTLPHDAVAEANFLAGLRRWTLRYTPWIGRDGDDGLALDITGCAHLFGGEEALRVDLLDHLRGFGFTARAAIADTKGAAWALARFGASGAGRAQTDPSISPPISPPGETRATLAELPVSALRLPAGVPDTLAQLGVRTVAQLTALPRASVARRFGRETIRRLDEAHGAAPEPVAPLAPPPHYAVRLSLPEPIGAVSDVLAGLDRLLERLCAHLARGGVGARTLRLTVRRVDHETRALEIGLARASRDPARIAPLFAEGVDRLDAGFGIDALRVQALVVEPLSARQADLGPDLRDRRRSADGRVDPADALLDLIGRLGVRLGGDNVMRLLPADSHAPEKAATLAAAAVSEPARDWPAHAAARPPRPLTRLRPDPIDPLEAAPSGPPTTFRWRRRAYTVATAVGPERIAPEWWLDDPNWRDGVRDYWRVDTTDGARLWLFHTPQAPHPPRWFAAGLFA